MKLLLEHDLTRKKFIKNNTDMDFFFKNNEHYMLLSTVSKHYENVKLYDIGSYRGLSALALSSNEKNLVISYDIGYFIEIDRPSNVEFRIGNFYNDRELLSSPLIVFDIDPHNGLDERNFVDYLIQHEYKGTVIFDDIHLNDEMEQFWDSITQEKQDFTQVGHGSGTGIVHFR